MWLQEQLDKGAFGVKKIPRAENFADMLTHPPSAAELQKFLPMMGIFPAGCSKGAFKLVETLLRQRPELHAQVASSVLSFLGSGKAKTGRKGLKVRFQGDAIDEHKHV